MAYCPNCGNPIEDSAQFCRSCGSRISEPAAGAAASPTPPPPPPPPVHPQAYPQQGGAYPPGGPVPPKAGRRLTWLLSGIGALAVVVAIVCVLVFVVFGDGNDGQEAVNTPTTLGETATSPTAPVVSTTVETVPPTSSTATTSEETSDPGQVVMQVFAAMEQQDTGAILALMDPVSLGDLPEGMTWDDVEATMAEELATMGSMKFSGIEMSTEITSETTATVTITAGIVTVTDASGETTSEDVKDADSPVTIELVKVDGKWYMESTPFL